MRAPKTCPHCGSILIVANEWGPNKQWVCHNDYCDINRESMRRRESAQTIGTGIGLGCLALQLAAVGAAVVGAFYGLYLLIGG